MLQIYVLYFKTIYKRAKKCIIFSFVCIKEWFWCHFDIYIICDIIKKRQLYESESLTCIIDVVIIVANFWFVS